jgi:hypothetical protein
MSITNSGAENREGHSSETPDPFFSLHTNFEDGFGGPGLAVGGVSRMKEAALFPPDAMGFQSTLVWRVVGRKITCATTFKGSSSI